MEPIRIFYCCTNNPQDKELRDELEKHLMALKRLKQITLRLTRDILAGTDWNQEQNERFQKADLILLLVSPDFISSDYHYGVEMQNALEKYKAGNACVALIILRPSFWERTLLGQLPVLPRDRIPITQCINRDNAFVTIVKEISEIVAHLLGRRIPLISSIDGEKLTNGIQKATPTTNFPCITCGVQNVVEANVCMECGDLLYTISEGMFMEHTPTDIKIERKRGSITAFFMLQDKHKVTYSNKSQLAYLNGKEISAELFQNGGYHFAIDGVDCFLYTKDNFWGLNKPHFEVGGISIF